MFCVTVCVNTRKHSSRRPTAYLSTERASFPSTNELWGKVIFSQVSVIPSVWECLPLGLGEVGVCASGSRGGGGVCLWVWDRWGSLCPVGDVHPSWTHPPDTHPPDTHPLDTSPLPLFKVNKRAVRILLECFLVMNKFYHVVRLPVE